MVIEIKKRYRYPFLLVTGDFSHWKIDEALADFPDVSEIDPGHTSRVFVNFGRAIKEARTLAPLETEEDDQGLVSKNDHRARYVQAELHKKRTFKWETYSYRHYNNQSVENFKTWIIMHDWREVLEAQGLNNKTDACQGTVTEAVEKFFPLETTRRKSSELPWMSKKLKTMIVDRKQQFFNDGGVRTAAWKEKKIRTEDELRKRKRGYMDTQREHILAKDANRNFFKQAEKPEPFDIREIIPDKSDKEVAEELSVYFNRISEEFDALEPGQIPQTTYEELPILQTFEVAARIKKFRKPKSMVKGDRCLPQAGNAFGQFFCHPACRDAARFLSISSSYATPHATPHQSHTETIRRRSKITRSFQD